MNTTPIINASAAQVELRPEQTFERFRSRQSYLGVAAGVAAGAAAAAEAAEAGVVAAEEEEEEEEEEVEAGVTVD